MPDEDNKDDRHARVAFVHGQGNSVSRSRRLVSGLYYDCRRAAASLGFGVRDRRRCLGDFEGRLVRNNLWVLHRLRTYLIYQYLLISWGNKGGC